MTKTEKHSLRTPTPGEIAGLESRGCSSPDWSLISLTEDTDLSLIRDTELTGAVSIGRLNRDCGHPVGIRNARITNCTLGDNVCIRNIGREIRGAEIGNDVQIENTAAIIFEPEAPCGNGVNIAVLDETGSRPVKIFPQLDAQLATLAALRPRWAEEALFPMLDEETERNPLTRSIGDGAEILDSGELLDVHVGRDVHIHGARRLCNGAIINNAGSSRGFAYVGHGVDAENFMIVDGKADSGAILRNTFIGQGAVLEKNFTSHDSLFFANCSMENGEACALLAGPYSVSMHKSTLLIGAMTSFMNAGSGTNQSNHTYKLGPVHWGIMERGVKTASFSYIMWGAKIGPFSLVMGSHKNHPDCSEFPFSYLFGDDKGATSIVPGMMLRSCGLMRDEKKWPTRDRRLKRKLPLHDRIHFSVLNPMTADRILDAIDLMRKLQLKPTDDDGFIRLRGMKMRRAHLERAEIIYTEALSKYLAERIDGDTLPETTGDEAEQWIDLGGQIITRTTLDEILHAESIDEIKNILDNAFDSFRRDELRWIANRFPDEWRRPKSELLRAAESFDRHIEDDRTIYRDNLTAEHAMLSL